MAYRAVVTEARLCHAAIAVVSLGLAVSLILADGLPRYTQAVLLGWWVPAVGAFYAARQWPRLVYAIVPVALAIAGTVAYESLVLGHTRASGLFDNANHAAGLLGLGTIAALATNDRRAAILAVGLAFAMALTGSRLGMGVTLVTFGMYAWRTRDLVPIAGLVAMLAAVLMLDDEALIRWRLVEAAWVNDATVRVFPETLGVAAFGQTELGWRFYHFTPLQVAFNAGWLAAIAWTGLVLGSLVYAIRRRSGLALIVPAALLTTFDLYFWWPGFLAPAFWAMVGAVHRPEAA